MGSIGNLVTNDGEVVTCIVEALLLSPEGRDPGMWRLAVALKTGQRRRLKR